MEPIGPTRTGSLRLPPDVLKSLSVKRDGPALLRAVVHVGIVLAGMALMWRVRGTGWMLPLFWVLGYPLAFLFNVVHETAHKTAFRTPWLNPVFGHLAGFAVLLPYEYYRAFHWDHHRFTQQAGKDPEMSTGLPHTRLGYVWLAIGFPLWFRRTIAPLVRRSAGTADQPWITDAKRPMIVREARLYLSGYLLIALVSLWLHSWFAVYAWLVPLAAGHMLLRPYLLAEHTGCGHSRDMFENTRTTYTNALVRWFAWNMPFHAEHHAFPSVPFHALPRLNVMTREHLRQTAPGYVAANRRIYRTLMDGAGSR